MTAAPMPSPKAATWGRLAGRGKARARRPAAADRKPPFRLAGGLGPYAPYDAYKSKRPPSKVERVQAYRNAAYVCASMRAEAVSMQPLRLYVTTDKARGEKAPRGRTRPIGPASERLFAASPHLCKKLAGVDHVDEVVTHPLIELLERVNPYFSKTMLLEATQLNLDIVGEWFWYVVPGAGGLPETVWPLPSWMVQVVADYAGTDVVSGYLFTGAGPPAPLEKERVLFGRELSLFDHYTNGWGALQANYEHTQIYDKNLAYKDSVLDNRGRPDAMLIPDEAFGAVSTDPDAVTRIQLEYEQDYRGGRSGRLWVPPGGMKLVPVSWPPKDMGELAESKAVLHDVARGFKVPIPLVDGEAANRANMDASLLMFARFAVKPACRKLEEYLNSNFVNRWDERLFLAFDDPVPADKVLDRDTAIAYVGAGIWSRNKVRADTGEAPVEGGDELMVSNTLVPLARALEPPDPVVIQSGEAPKPDEVPEEDRGTAEEKPGTEDDEFAEGQDVESARAGKAWGREQRRPFGGGGRTKFNPHHDDRGRFGSGHSGGGGGKPVAARGEMAEATREGTGKDARIVLADGSPAPPHIKPSMVPPGWSGVKVGTDPKADVLVTAKDAKGRPKTVYSESYQAKTAENKFARVGEMIDKHDAITGEIQAARKNPKLKEEADCSWLMSVQATRPGSDRDTQAKVKAYGATTLRAEHVVESPQGVKLQFVGKEGIHHDHLIRDENLGKMLVERKASAGERAGKLFDTNDAKVRDFAGTLGGGGFSPKDFRTSAATRLAVDHVKANPAPSVNLKEHRTRVMDVATKVSKLLGNKPAQALESYIHPSVFEGWRPR